MLSKKLLSKQTIKFVFLSWQSWNTWNLKTKFNFQVHMNHQDRITICLFVFLEKLQLNTFVSRSTDLYTESPSYSAPNKNIAGSNEILYPSGTTPSTTTRWRYQNGQNQPSSQNKHSSSATTRTSSQVKKFMNPFCFACTLGQS